MNERIRELALQAGSTHKQNLGVYQFYTDELEKFADLIRADEREACAEHYLGIMRGAIAEEREACAKVAEQNWYEGVASVGKAIRARGNT